MTKILGIDPGFSGALALYDTEYPNTVTLVEDMPVVKKTIGKSKRDRLDMPGLEKFLKDNHVDVVVIEDPGTRPRQSGTMAFGHALGCVHGLLFSLRIRFEEIVPTKWKNALRVPKDKKEAVSRAEELFPACREMFRGPRGGLMDGRAEAAMIALYGAQNFI